MKNKKKKAQEKSFQYATQILSAMSALFDEDHESFISSEELYEGDNLTHFIHALVNIAPTALLNTLTNDDKNQLECNHIANQLCFQYNLGVKNDNNE